MSVRKRTWTTAKGEEKTAWIVDYVDAKGIRRQKTFKLKKQADAFAATASVEVREGTHVADRDTVTVEKSGSLWISSGESSGLERSTTNQRKNHLENHIKPLIGSTLLSKLTLPAVRDFEDRLRKEGRSPAMTKKIITSLGSILADANERGLATRNPVRDMRGGRKGRERRAERRQKGRLEIGVDIPSRDEIKALIAALDAHQVAFNKQSLAAASGGEALSDAKFPSESVVAADQPDELALDLHPIGPKNPCFVGRVRGFERDRCALAPEALQRRFLIIHERHDDIAGIGRIAIADNHGVAVEDAGFDHRVALDFESVVFAVADHVERNGNVVRVVLDGRDRHTGSDAAHDRHGNRCVVGHGRGLRRCGRWRLAEAALDHAGREAAAGLLLAGRVGFRKLDDLERASPVRQTANEPAFFECRDQTVNAGLRRQVERILHFIE